MVSRRLVTGLFLLFVYALIRPILDFPYNLFGVSLVWVHKLAYVMTFAVSLVVIVRGRRLRLWSFSGLLFAALAWGLLRGIYMGNEFSSAALAQAVYFLGPIVFLNAGYNLRPAEVDLLLGKIARHAVKIFVLLLALLAAYLYLHHVADLWEYFGYSSGILYSAMMIDQRLGSRGLIAAFALDLLSGKRSAILLWLLYFVFRKPIVFIALALLAALYLASIVESLPERYQNVLEVDLLDPASLYLATGGRSVEWTNIMEHLDGITSGWWLGGGLGAVYVTADPISMIDEILHYSHFTPFTFTLISGIAMACLIYGSLIYYSIRFHRYPVRPVYHYWLIMLILSLMGPSLVAEPWPWIFLGMMARYYGHPKPRTPPRWITFRRPRGLRLIASRPRPHPHPQPGSGAVAAPM